eukprot:Opistho-2@13562
MDRLRHWASSICPARIMHPHPQSVVKELSDIGEKFLRYESHMRLQKSVRKDEWVTLLPDSGDGAPARLPPTPLSLVDTSSPTRGTSDDDVDETGEEEPPRSPPSR